MLRKADFHLGQHVNTFFRIRCKTTSGTSVGNAGGRSSERTHISMYATLDGGLGYIMPLHERHYRRLLMLQNVLVTQIPHSAGLNPKAFRTYNSSTKLLSNPARGIVDGELVQLFAHLTASERHELAKKIGTKVNEIIDDLIDIDLLTTHF